MNEAFVECVRCAGLYRVEYDGTVPTYDGLVCRCGATLFEEVDRRDAVRDHATPPGRGHRFDGYG